MIAAILIGLIVAAIVYFVGQEFGAPQPILGLIALLIFCAFIFGGI